MSTRASAPADSASLAFRAANSRAGVADSGEDRHLPGDFIHHDLDRPATVVPVEERELAARAHDEQAVDTSIEGMTRDLAQACFVDLAVLRQRCEQRRNDAGQVV